LSDHEPVFKFGQNFDFENLPALKPIDDEPVKIKEAAEAVKFDGFIEPGDLEAKKNELSENLQAINEALSEIDALDEMSPKKDEFDETAKATAQDQSICDETPDVKFGGDNVSLDDLGIKFTQKEVGMQQHPSEKDQILDFFQNEFSIVQDEENKDIDFYGNIESTKIMDGDVDVVVTDGYTGNVLLKTSEGVGKFIFHIVKESIMESWIAKLGALLIKGAMKKVKKKTEASEYGGAIFLGLSELSLKAHGNSDSRAIKNALKVASKFIELNFIEELRKTMEVE